jgi:arylsulfatase
MSRAEIEAGLKSPLEVKIQANGDIYIRAKDPAYATPGPDEVQKF